MNMVIYTPQTVECLNIYTKQDSVSLYIYIYIRENELGTIGSFAPFHSHIQKSETTTIPEISVARTIDECQENVTPP